MITKYFKLYNFSFPKKVAHNLVKLLLTWIVLRCWCCPLWWCSMSRGLSCPQRCPCACCKVQMYLLFSKLFINYLIIYLIYCPPRCPCAYCKVSDLNTGSRMFLTFPSLDLNFIVQWENPYKVCELLTSWQILSDNALGGTDFILHIFRKSLESAQKVNISQKVLQFWAKKQ